MWQQPEQRLLFQAIVARNADVYCVVHIVITLCLCDSALMKGVDSHKKIDLAGNPILRHYYTNRVSMSNVVA